ncbi:MAG: TonB family protein [Gemmatimonadales bacterium]|nr:TonB family protein [Gemmatimonadales bacterium]NIN11372.1 TonB family protein [Gemmatimonadales bacterium]NIN49981.1 TonB family protein [Gemmatimonadales bacterium]NIP07445.1 TonB family protein [Gemmatimonadales bacterium]NIR00513.1 TonB family protein [Gemmatimonadales bacterium]
MFDNLVESNRRGRRDVRGTVLGLFTSSAFQALVVIGAVYATMRVPPVEHLLAFDTILLPPDDRQVQEEPKAQRPVVMPLTPDQIGFKVPILPTEIPTGIPPVDPEVSFDARNYTGVGVEGGVFRGIEDVIGSVGDLARIFEHGVVDEVPERISCPVPAYPRMMQQANIEGQVLLQFVVETDGHVLEEHIETLSSSHRAFEGPAKEMISKCLFRPGRVRTSPVRVLVQMPIIFDLAGRR